MHELILAGITGGVALTLALVTAYLLGHARGETYYVPGVRPAPPATPTPEKALPDVEAHAVVPPWTVVPHVDFTTLPPEPDVEDPSRMQWLADERERLMTENATLAAQLERMTRNRELALGRARVAAARVSYLVSDVFHRRRRPKPAELAAETIDVGTRTVPVIPAALIKGLD